MHIVTETSKRYLVKIVCTWKHFYFRSREKRNKANCIFACLMLFYFRKEKTRRKRKKYVPCMKKMPYPNACQKWFMKFRADDFLSISSEHKHFYI